MDHGKRSQDEAKNLREQAERKVQGSDLPLTEMSEADVAAFVHELQVHQIELEMQNDELHVTQTELEQSRTRYADLFDFAPVGYLLLDRDGMIVEANLTAATMLQIDRGWLAGKPFSLYIGHTSKDVFRHHQTAVFKTGEPQECDIELSRKDKAPLTVRLRSRPVTNAQGKVIQTQTVMMNITAQIRTEQRLKDSERRFRTLTENSPDIIARVDRDMRVVYVNKAVERALGIPPEGLIGRRPDEFGVPEALSAQWTEAIQRTFKTGKGARTDFDYPGPQQVRHYSATSVPEFEEDGTANTVLITVDDVTERVDAEEKYSTVIRNLQDGFCIVDSEGRYIEVNEGYARMLGLSPEEFLHAKVWDVLEPELHAELADHLGKAFEQGWDKFAITHKRKDGSPVDCDVTLQRLNGDRLFVFARDITEQRIAEEQRMESLQRFDLVTRATNDGIWDWDIATDTCWHNAVYATALGYSPEEIGRDTDWWRQRIHPDDREDVLSTLGETLQNGSDVWLARYRLRRKDDSYAWVMDRGYIVRDERGNVVRMVGSTMDLTEKLELVGQLESERGKLVDHPRYGPDRDRRRR